MTEFVDTRIHPRYIEIISEDFACEEPTIFGLLNDKSHSIKFQLTISKPNNFWNLYLLPSVKKRITIYDFPFFHMSDYFDRSMINYIIDSFGILISKV